MSWRSWQVAQEIPDPPDDIDLFCNACSKQDCTEWRTCVELQEFLKAHPYHSLATSPSSDETGDKNA